MRYYSSKAIVVILICCIIIKLLGCSGTYRYQLADIKPTIGKKKSEIQVFLKDGTRFKLKEFEILTGKVIGIDALGKRREVALNDIEKVFIIEESSIGRKIVSTVLATGILSYLVFILLIAIFGIPGGGLQ